MSKSLYAYLIIKYFLFNKNQPTSDDQSNPFQNKKNDTYLGANQKVFNLYINQVKNRTPRHIVESDLILHQSYWLCVHRELVTVGLGRF